ncbi:hypothetical protein O6H91_15G027300 [Diphasiastrum complanatum]|uniref:Uncharacterized protein n=1 Tax=Diphasiastrum complanatum TaxID=34168 RepID=A0ACC2BGP3_DIPCM|nr:hypothetical protein O6H91_15G027300 [Diphasiastrum complanatum]
MMLEERFPWPMNHKTFLVPINSSFKHAHTFMSLGRKSTMTLEANKGHGASANMEHVTIISSPNLFDPMAIGTTTSNVFLQATSCLIPQNYLLLDPMPISTLQPLSKLIS